MKTYIINWSGLTDDDLVNIGLKFIEKYKFIVGKNILIRFAKSELNLNFPKHFSKNRFGGKHKNYYKILEEKSGLTYNPYHKNRKITLI